MDHKKAERINQELQKKLCQTFQTEAAIDFACDQDRVLREHFPQVARSHREEILPPELEEILRAETSGRAPNCSALVDKLYREDRDERVQGSEFQNPAGAAGVLTMPTDSQSPWQNGKTERAGQSFKHQLWDLDVECHIVGETESEAASGRVL